jgi:AcrR family transcriptional regulator
MGRAEGLARRRPRSDGLRNRERLLSAAREVFGEGGAASGLEAVARRAGVGIGTLYRHFPSREALFQAVYRHEIDDLVDLANRLASDPDPAQALRRWLHANIAVVATKKGMIVTLAPSPDSSRELYVDSRARLTAAVGVLMQRAQAARSIRDDISPEDMLQTLYACCYGSETAAWQATATRLLDVFVDGLSRREA